LQISDFSAIRYRIPILSVGVTPMTMREASAIAEDAVSTGVKRRYVFCTTHTLVEAQDRQELKAAVTGHDVVVTTDGMPLVWLSRLKGARQIERVYGPDALLEFCHVGVPHGWKHFFYGATEKTLGRLVANLQARFPDLIVAGTYAPPFRPLGEEERLDVAARINAAAPDLVWVGLGMPKQEVWMHEFRPLLDAPVILAVGAAFDFHSGVVKQAPRWMQRSGLEWLYRLAREPKRLWRRYLFCNTRFVWLVAREAIAGAARRLPVRPSL
jgi:N-acetylglucosaminyldiphosphoundecaprenol N-acetyl-beta-D-mannosaminyltransferase